MTDGRRAGTRSDSSDTGQPSPDREVRTWVYQLQGYADGRLDQVVLAVDDADQEKNVREACRRYAEEGFAGYVGPVGLDEVRTPC